MAVDRTMLASIVKNPKALCKLFFNIDTYPSQEAIVADILYGRERKIIILAMTRYGKSFILAAAILLYVFFNPNKRVVIIGPQEEQAGVVMEWIRKFIASSKFLESEIEMTSSGIERLKKEITKRRITLRNGSEIRILSAHGKGAQLMGFGADVVVEDESALISDAVHEGRIRRMLGDNPKTSIHIQIGNAYPGNHYEKDWNSGKFKKHFIDWRKALAEGRTTKEFIDDERDSIPPIEFQILYDAVFPSEPQGALIKWSWINAAIEREFEGDVESVSAGADIAEEGRDLTVLTISEKLTTNKYVIKEPQDWHEADTTVTSDRIDEQLTIISDFNTIKVDANGVGHGVADELRKRGFDVVYIKGGRKATVDEFRYKNLNAQMYWQLRKLFEQGRISIPNNHKLINELRLMLYKLEEGTKKIRIIKPENKSPDFADSLAYAVYEGNHFSIGLLEDEEGILI